MRTTDLPISPLPPEIAAQLQKHGRWFVSSTFSKELVGPPIVLIGSCTYYRFMDYIYLPCPPEDLTPEQVIEVCDLRLDHLNQLVNFRLNEAVVVAMAGHVLSHLPAARVNSLKVLDFGCGSGLSMELMSSYLPNCSVVGVDISEKAIDWCQKDGFEAVYAAPGSRLPFDSATFDVVCAVFVMHFGVDDLSLSEVARVTGPNGIFIFNTYHRDIALLLEKLKSAGLESSTVLRGVPGIPDGHLIVAAQKLPHSEE